MDWQPKLEALDLLPVSYAYVLSFNTIVSSVNQTIILFVSVELNSDGKIYQPYLKINYEVVDDSADVS